MLDLDFTPDPQILIALTHNPLKPLDAICELIDNSIDAFRAAKLAGRPITFPQITVELPTASEADRGQGVVRVRDNGLGLSIQHAQDALRAGYSSKNRHDTLGLFGVGFNIATGKLGERTKFQTAQEDDPYLFQVVIDLPKFRQQKSYRAQGEQLEKPAQFKHGTIVEVSGWWPAGNPNHDFIRKLAQYPKTALARDLGRRYATLIREENLRITVGHEQCEAFEHCVWDASRFVERRNIGRIPARYDFNEVVAHQTWCNACDSRLIELSQPCPNCNSTDLRTIEERVRGWVGIQRYDSTTNYGIDLIRNGRAIAVSEQTAFFTFMDDFGNKTTDYPIDQIYGRIVGEVHMDHVPVDFTKQDFQRNTEEWQRALAFLRGASSLQPQQPGASSNASYIYRLYQGYRKVRNVGRADMYMGYWDTASNKPQRISREKEREYLQKFKDKVPGYHDDVEWWRLVEDADTKPVEPLVECPSCSAENLQSLEECAVCGRILRGKTCVNQECGTTILLSAVTCPECGESQIPEIKLPWSCEVCQAVNRPNDERCGTCSNPRGALNPASPEFLRLSSDKDDSLSIQGCSVALANGSFSPPIDVETYMTRQAIVKQWQGERVPLISVRGPSIEIFVDKAHPLYQAYGARPELLVAYEVGQYLYESYRSLLTARTGGIHSIAALAAEVVEEYWGETLNVSPIRLREEINELFGTIRLTLPKLAGELSESIFDALNQDQVAVVVKNLVARGMDVTRIGALKRNGEFLSLIDNRTIVEVFRRWPAMCFDGGLWKQRFSGLEELPEEVANRYRDTVTMRMLNCLEDCVSFLQDDLPDPLIVTRVQTALKFLVSNQA